MKHVNSLIIFALLLATCAFTVPVTAEEQYTPSFNKSKFQNMGVVNGSPNWAGMRDLSQFSRYEPQVEVTLPSRETLKKLYPNIIFYDSLDLPMGERNSSEEVTFNQDGSFSVFRTQSNQNKLTATTDVRITEAQIAWYWVQDSVVRHLITVRNVGSVPASGKVIVISPEDGYGYYNTFSNLPPSASETVSVAYMVPSGSSVGRKPIVLEVWVDPDDTRTDSWLMPITFQILIGAQILKQVIFTTSLMDLSPVNHMDKLLRPQQQGMTQQLHMLQHKRSWDTPKM